MDFAFTDEEQALVDLAEQIITDKVDHASLRALEMSGDRVDESTWGALADAGVLTALLPSTLGGADLGAVAAAGLLEVSARHAAALPLLPATAALATLATFGSPHPELVAALADGSRRAAVALGAGVRATGSTLNGSVSFVMSGLDADVVLVEAGDQLFLADLTGPGVTRVEQPTTTGYADAILTFEEATAQVVGESSAPVAFLRQRVDLGICALTAGLTRGALNLAASYAGERMQFNRVIASFQAVSQRVGDAYIDVQGLELTTYQAAWRIDAGLAVDRELAVARWWAAEAGFRVVHAAVHVHGGVGVDRDYPLHRYFLLARRLELTLGNSEEQLAKIGRAIAAS